MDLLVIGGVGAAALYMLKRPGFDPNEGSAPAETEDYADTDGIVRPHGTLGDLVSQQSLAMQRDMENEQITNNMTSVGTFNEYIASEQGQVEFNRWLKKHHMDGAGSKINKAQAIKKFEMEWRSKNHDTDNMRSKVLNIHKRTTMNAAVQSTNMFDPDRFVTVRNRPTTTPRIGEFAGSNTSLNGHETWLDHSPYVLTDYGGIPESPWASTRDAVRSEVDTLVDRTQVVATAAPTKMLGKRGGAVRMNFKDMTSKAKAVHHETADPEWQPTDGGQIKHAKKYKRVV